MSSNTKGSVQRCPKALRGEMLAEAGGFRNALRKRRDPGRAERDKKMTRVCHLVQDVTISRCDNSPSLRTVLLGEARMKSPKRERDRVASTFKLQWSPLRAARFHLVYGDPHQPTPTHL